MTKVIFTRRNAGIIQVECKGHSGYAKQGQDIVCAAISGMVQTALLGLLKIANVEVEYTSDESKGYLSMCLPQNVTQTQWHDCQVVLGTLWYGVCDLSEGYSKYVSMEVKEL